MHRGSIAIGEIKCDSCNNTIEHGERYLIIEEENASAVNKNTAEIAVEPASQRICLNCSIQKKYVTKKREKGEDIYTFFT